MVSADDSRIISLLRGVLALLVVYIHVGATYSYLGSADYPLLSGQGIANSIVLGVHLLTSIAVPAFFVMSGFLFFHKLEEWNTDVWKDKIRSRCMSLLVPYILWNIIAVLFSGNIRENITNLHFLWDIIKWDSDATNWLGLSMASSGPMDMPLWFVRDLMGMVLVSPLIYYATKKLRYTFVLCSFLLRCASVYPYCPGLGSIAMLFFSVGACLQLCKGSLYGGLYRWRYVIVSVFVISMCFFAYAGGYKAWWVETVHNIYLLSGTLLLLLLTGLLSRKSHIREVETLSKGSFWVFAMHGLILGEVMELVYRCMPGAGLVKYIPAFLIAPVVTALLILLLYRIAALILPASALKVFGVR